MSRSVSLKTIKLPREDLAYLNKVFVSNELAARWRSMGASVLRINGFIVEFDGLDKIKEGCISMSGVQRKFLGAFVSKETTVTALVEDTEDLPQLHHLVAEWFELRRASFVVGSA